MKYELQITILPILRFYLKIDKKVMYRFYNSSDLTIRTSDFTILPQDCHESDNIIKNNNNNNHNNHRMGTSLS